VSAAAELARALAEVVLVDGEALEPFARKYGPGYLAQQIAYAVTGELGTDFAETLDAAALAVEAVIAEQRSAA
jgi:restriction endonuclease Mrr